MIASFIVHLDLTPWMVILHKETIQTMANKQKKVVITTQPTTGTNGGVSCRMVKTRL